MQTLDPKIENLRKNLKELYKIKEDLQKLDSRWKFTLDGKLVGDIGEMIVCHIFGLEPLKGNSKKHDAETRIHEKINVQIKTTQKDTVGLGTGEKDFEHLIVLKIDVVNAEWEVIYNGPGLIVAQVIGNKNSITVKQLKILNESDQAKKTRLLQVNELN